MNKRNALRLCDFKARSSPRDLTDEPLPLGGNQRATEHSDAPDFFEEEEEQTAGRARKWWRMDDDNEKFKRVKKHDGEPFLCNGKR